MEEQVKRIAVFGAGGHGKVVIDAIRRLPAMVVACVVDDRPMPGMEILGEAVIGGREALLGRKGELDGVIVAIGDNRDRARVAEWLVAQDFVLATVAHPAAVVARSATIGAGCLFMPGAVVNACARIGANVIVNSGAIVEHDCEVGENAHIAPGAVLCGEVCIGAGTLVGAGAVVLPGVRIGRGLLVKAGAVAVRDMENGE